jgi:rhodanese-related sulfurtransferase
MCPGEPASTKNALILCKENPMKPWIMIAAVCWLFSATGAVGAEPAAQPKWMSTPVKERIDKARAETKQVSIEELKAAIDNNENVAVIDVREPNEYEVAHIPGAINVPRGLLEFSIWTVVPNKEKKIFVYCKTGGRAALSTKTLNELGYINAVAVATGGAAWGKAGYPVQTSITDDEVVIMPVAR